MQQLWNISCNVQLLLPTSISAYFFLDQHKYIVRHSCNNLRKKFDEYHKENYQGKYIAKQENI